MRSLLILAAVGLLPAGASASIAFFPHRGGPNIVRGSGGTSIASHGITVWTRGMPARAFQVLGTIRDRRTDKLLDGQAGRSAAVAKLVRAHGGDAVLMGGVTTKPIAVKRGGVGGVFGTPSYSGQGDVVVSAVTTDLVVIRSDPGSRSPGG